MAFFGQKWSVLEEGDSDNKIKNNYLIKNRN